MDNNTQRMEVKYAPVAGEERFVDDDDDDQEVASKTGGGGVVVEMKTLEGVEKNEKSTTTQTEESGSRSFLYIAACAGQYSV